MFHPHSIIACYSHSVWAVRNGKVCPHSLSLSSLLCYLKLCLWKYIYLFKSSCQWSLARPAKSVSELCQRWKVEAQHKPSIMFSLFFSLPPHLCGNHFQFVSLLSLPGLSQEDPFMIDVVAVATPALQREGPDRSHSPSSEPASLSFKKPLLRLQDRSGFFCRSRVFFSWILRGWRSFLKFSVCLREFFWRAPRLGVLLCGVQMLPVHVFESVWNSACLLTWCFTVSIVVCRAFLMEEGRCNSLCFPLESAPSHTITFKLSFRSSLGFLDSVSSLILWHLELVSMYHRWFLLPCFSGMRCS